MRRSVRWGENERASTTTVPPVEMAILAHEGRSPKPARAEPDAVVWCWGEVTGTTGERNRARPAGVRSASYLARLYERHGIEVASELNGSFVAAVYDREREVVHLLTDRLGTRPLYYARLPGGSLAVATHVQALASHPSVDTTLDPDYLSEYLSLGHVGGVKTPIEEIESFPPSSVITVDATTGETRTDRYWEPRYRPVDLPFERFVDRFIDAFSQVFEERYRPGRTHGLLLSGGSDSRLLLAAANDAAAPNEDTPAYHMADWMSKEARIAERTAMVADVPFTLLRRDEDYQRHALATNPAMMNFYGRFDQGHPTGFRDRLTNEVDVVLTGLYADTLFKDQSIPTRPNVPLGPLGSLPVPIARRIDSVEEYLDLFPEAPPASFDSGTGIRSILEENIHRDGDAIVDHGVRYPSLESFLACRAFYPMSNDPDLFYWGLTQLLPHWTPFLDNRLVDLALTYPRRYALRRDVVNAALTRLAPDLASIPHPATNVRLDRPFPLQYVGDNLTRLKRNLGPDDTPPQSYYTNGPWTNPDDLLVDHPFVNQMLQEKRDLLDRLPGFDPDRVDAVYRAHTEGGDHTKELFHLLSFLWMPATEQFVEPERDPRTRERTRAETRTSTSR